MRAGILRAGILGLLALLAASAAMGCASPSGGACVVDEAVLAEHRSCIGDDDCPCGAYCGAGVCEFDCRASSDCAAGSSCDRFGRCVAGEPRIGAVSFAAAARLTVSTTSLRLDTQHPEGVLSVRRAATGELGPTRVRGRDGARVRCPDQAEFSDECVLLELTPGAPATIAVTTADPSVEGTASVDVITDGGSETVSVATGDAATPTRTSIEGRWQGNAYLVGVGSRARPTTSITSQALAELPMPVSLVVHPELAGRRPVELSATDALVFPESPTLGEIRRGSDGALQLRHARRPFLAYAGAEAVNVLVSAQSSTLEQVDGTMTVLLQSTYVGAASDAMSPTLEWRLVLRRVGELPSGGAPTIATDAVLGDTAERARVRLGIENVGRTLLADALATETQPLLLAQRALCTPSGATNARVFTPSVPTRGWSGDLLCLEDRPGAIDESAQLALGPYSAASFDIATTIPGCVSDLGRMIRARDGVPPAGEGRGCIDGPRFAVALVESTTVDRARALGDPGASAPDPSASALTHRLVQQWAEMLAFVATQAVQMDRLNDVLGDGVGSTGIDRDFNQNDMLERTAAGWDLLLHPRVATALAAMPGSVIVRADYRTRLFPTTTFPTVRYHDQGVGVPVALASALERSIDAHNALLDRARYVTADLPRAIELARAFARRSIVLFALATALHDTALAANPTLAWEQSWQLAASGYGSALTRMVRALELARDSGNPLGIDDTLDLPLYRVGDETSPLARFSAVSDYLLGTDGSGDASPVGAAVATAEARRADARAAFSTALVREFAQETEESLTNRRIAAVSLGYGGDLQSLCGDPDLDPDAAVAGEQAVDPETCWIRPDCRRTGAEAIESASPERIAVGVCRWRLLVDRAPLALGAYRRAAEAMQTPAVDALLAGTDTVRGLHLSADGSAIATLRSGARVTFASVLVDGSTDPTAPGGDVPPEVMTEIEASCAAVGATNEAARPGTTPTRCELVGDCASGHLCRDNACVVDIGTDQAPACYRGYVGELAIALRGAVTDIELARSEAAELQTNYGIRMSQCAALIHANDRREAAYESLNRTMNILGGIRLGLQAASNAARAVQDCGSISTENLLFGGGGAACGAAVTAAVLDTAIAGIEFGMEMVQREHEALMQRIDTELEERTCTLEADLELVGVHSATLRVNRAIEEVNAQLVAIANAKAQIRVTLNSGRSEYARELADAVPPIEFDYWLNSTAVEYDASFRRARRALYLAVLALEYEFQLSSSERTAVLSATGVSQLRASLVRLRNLAGTGTVAGAAPSPLLSVVSLRTELLSVADRTGDAPGEQALSEVERLRLLLASPRYARYGADGAYLGQEIPFRLAPFSAAAESGAVPILAGEDCAERIWSMNASILGEGVIQGTDSTRTRITLRKRNTFFSQWCGAVPTGAPYQLAATRPSRNLLLDPSTDFVPAALDPRTGTFDALHEADAFASARLQPVIGVSRATLEADDYFNGASRELAGRGLYGDYALFIPAESLSRPGSPGLDLSRVDDILLRFDYVSVARR